MQSIDTGAEGDLTVNETLLVELRELHKAYPEPKLRLHLAMAIRPRVTYLYKCDAKNLTSALLIVDELRQLWVDFPERDVCRALVLTLNEFSGLLVHPEHQELATQLRQEASKLPDSVGCT